MKKRTGEVEDLVMTIFHELAGERAGQLKAAIPNANSAIRKSLATRHSKGTASDIAFHLTDWNYDAAFIVALLLFPERFSPAQIRAGIERFAIHAPNHVAAAAKLCGWPVEDIFDVGALTANSEGN